MNRKEIIAAACHSAWYAYTVLGFKEEGEPWSTIAQWQKDSLYNAIEFWDTFTEKVPVGGLAWLRTNLPVLSHDNWTKHKLSEGWIYGPVKDANKKTHPCLVPYTALPAAQQLKDSVVVETYLAMNEVL